MKLYTEEQVRKALDFFLTDENKKSQVLETLTPIELPTDEEIENGYEPKTMYDLGYLDGAKWMRNKIQGGKK